MNKKQHLEAKWLVGKHKRWTLHPKARKLPAELHFLQRNTLLVISSSYRTTSLEILQDPTSSFVHCELNTHTRTHAPEVSE